MILAALISGCAGKPVAREPASPAGGGYTFFSTPEDLHRSWLDAINGAESSIFMEMFHLTDPEVVAALRAKPRTMSIQLILDGVNLKAPGTAKVASDLVADRPNIQIYPSSGPPAGFTQTHTKAMVVDGKLALITSINLTSNAAIQRDYGVSTSDPAIIREMTTVFTADIANSKNAAAGSGPVRATPDGVGAGELIWSPVNSEARLVSLIGEAAKIAAGPARTIDATVENLGDGAIEAALSKAAKSGVQVRIIVPQCVLGANGPRNYGFFATLKNGVQYRVMPHPSSARQPYMHGKMIVLGNGRAYLGSVNFSKNSTRGNRELGIILTSATVSQQLEQLFDADWRQSAEVPDPAATPQCPTTTTDPSQ
jgi:phosphatidylserine/phosphatidylglycerophosphate/cardiolipin synthase-like enzyme